MSKKTAGGILALIGGTALLYNFEKTAVGLLWTALALLAILGGIFAISSLKTAGSVLTGISASLGVLIGLITFFTPVNIYADYTIIGHITDELFGFYFYGLFAIVTEIIMILIGAILMFPSDDLK